MSKVKKMKKKYHLWEKIFIVVSIVFIIGCIVFYGNRLIKYYKIYNPKLDDGEVELIMNAIVKDSAIVYENDGLYRISGQYIYKGENVNNYIRYSGLLWRIVKFNNDGSLDIVLDDNINMLKWDNEIKDFTNADIYKYLNNYFYKLIDYNYLTNVIICNDIINDITKITCSDKIMDSYVRLLSVSDYLNSKADKSYIENGRNIWLSNRSDELVWNINDANLSSSLSTNMYDIKPVVTLKNSTVLISGTGTKTDPYIIDQNKLGVGSFVKLDQDIWVIYDKYNDTYKLSLAEPLSNMELYSPNSTLFDVEEEDTLAYYLNNDYYESLSYKDKLTSSTWYSGSYNSYEDILKDSVTSKVGILNVSDLKLSRGDNYYLMTPSNDDKIYLYSEKLVDSKPNLQRSIIPAISMDSIKIISGQGSLEDPYVLEV